MKSIRITFSAALLLFFAAIGFCAEEAAQSPASPAITSPETQPHWSRERKLHRGLVNTATGWMDAPKTVDSFTTNRNWFEGITTGVARGFGLAVARTGVGIHDAVTFAVPSPENFEPLMQPEYSQPSLENIAKRNPS